MDRLLTCEEVAKLLSLKDLTVRRWTKEGKIPCVRIGGRAVRYRPSDLEKWIQDNSAGGEGGPDE